MLNRKHKVELSPKLKLGVRRTYTQNQLLKYSGTIFIALAVFLSINAIRLFKNQTSSQLASEATPKVLDAQDQIEFTDYTVTQGDTIFTVAQKFNIDWTTLVSLNNLTPPLKLQVGQKLKVPKKQ